MKRFVVSVKMIKKSDHFYLLFCLIIITVLPGSSTAQWVSSPEQNTLLSGNCINPINILAVEDQIGGLFLLWQETKSGLRSDINFLHVNGDGKLSFRADGKRISGSGISNSVPVCKPGPYNSAYIIWKETGPGSSEQIRAQRVSSSGNLLWDKDGIIISSGTRSIGDFSAASDKNGRLFICYLPREADGHGFYGIRMQVLSSDGKLMLPEGLDIPGSPNKKSSVLPVVDNTGSLAIFWLENITDKTVLMSQIINISGNLNDIKKPSVISDPSINVYSFIVKIINSNFYVVWQTQKENKDIYHQLVNRGGKILWQKSGVQVLPSKGDQLNPQPIISEGNILLTWTDDSAEDKNILIQKYDINGAAMWNKSGIPVIKIRGDQFGQKVVSDGNQGAIITWIDRRFENLHGNIYAQRINNEGKILWDSSGILIASSKNTEKSYTSVIPDVTGGVVVVFKEKRDGKNMIFGHKVFNTGTFTSQIIAFTSNIEGDSVKLSWYCANETGNSDFLIERTTHSDTSENAWQLIGNIATIGNTSAKHYEYYDRPASRGIIYYRVVHSDRNGNIQPSDIATVNYLSGLSSIFVSQNLPNPFSDSTTISIYLPEAKTVLIEFYDSHVEKVKEIVQAMSQGLNKISLKAADLNPGIYFYKVHIGDFVDVKKMVVIN